MNPPAYQPAAPQPDLPVTATLLKVLTPEIARALPKGMDADRIARLVTTEIYKSRNAKAAGISRYSLEECTQESFAGALLTSSALGLEPGVGGECWLIPYRDNRRQVVECQLIIGYQGVVKLFWLHPRAASVDTQCVYANDEFRYSKGLAPTLEHVPAAGDRGDPVAYYAIVRVTGADPLWDVFTAEDVKRLRRGKVGSSGDIPDPARWMERKTALKQVLKLAPKTTRLDMALWTDERGGTELSRSRAIELPAAVAPTPNYVDGDVAGEEPESPDGDEPVTNAVIGGGHSATRARPDQRVDENSPPPEEEEEEAFLGPPPTRSQLARLKQIRVEQRYDSDTDWYAYVEAATGARVGSDKQLTAVQAQELIGLFEQPAAGDVEVAMVTKAQLTKLHVLFDENGLSDRDAYLAWLAALVEHPLGSSKELTKAEATRAIDTLERQESN